MQAHIHQAFPTTALALALATLGAGCSFDDGQAPGDGSDALRERLSERQTLVLEAASDVGVTALNNAGQPIPCVQPTVTDGEAVIRAAENNAALPAQLIVEGMTVNLSDVYVPAAESTYPADLHLTEVRLRLGTQLVLEPEWSFNGDFAVGTGRADLLLDWSLLEDDGDALPLATQLLRDVTFDVYVELTDDAAVVTEVRANVAGSLWNFSVIELTDLKMDIRATTADLSF